MFHLHRSRLVLAAFFALGVLATVHQGLPYAGSMSPAPTAHIAGTDPSWPPQPQLPILH